MRLFKSRVERKQKVLAKNTYMPIDGPRPLTPKQRLVAITVILSAMAAAAAISLFVLMGQSLRLDESQTLWQSSHTLGGVLNVVAKDVHVPLYHLIVHVVIVLFGGDVETIRLLSLGFFLLTIPVIYAIAREVLRFRWALFATVVFSLSPFMLWYATEARMYTMLVLVASLNQLFFLRIIRRNKGWVPFALTAILGAYSHYFFLFTLAAQGIYFLIRRHSFAPGSFKKLVLTAILVVAALSPWIYYFTSLGSASNTRPLLVRPSSVDFSNVFSQFILGFQTDQINTLFLSSWPIVMLLALIAVRRSKKIDPAIGYIVTIAIVPILLAFAISLLIRPFFVSRYMVACVAPLFIFIIWLISQYRQKFALFAASLLVVMMGIGSIEQITSKDTPIKENYKDAVAYINQNAVPQDLVVLSSPFTVYPVGYYYTGPAQIQTLPIWDRAAAGAIPAFDESRLPQEVASQNENHRYIYLLLSQDQGYEETIAQYYRNNFKQVSRETFSEGLTLYVYQVGYYTVPPLEQATEPVN